MHLVNTARFQQRDLNVRRGDDPGGIPGELSYNRMLAGMQFLDVAISKGAAGESVGFFPNGERAFHSGSHHTSNREWLQITENQSCRKEQVCTSFSFSRAR